MIQRIQSLYLLAALLLMGLMLFVPFAEIAGRDGSIYVFGCLGLSASYAGEVTTVMRTWPVFILILILSLLLFISILLYGNRKLQMRVCVYVIILEFGLIGLSYYYFVVAFRRLEAVGNAIRIPVIVPVIVIVLVYLAFRGIRKDEILVRSIDKIR